MDKKKSNTKKQIHVWILIGSKYIYYSYQMDLCVVTQPDKGHKKCILVPVGKFTHGTIKAFCLNVTWYR